MTTHAHRVELRYRPSADVLVARVVPAHRPADTDLLERPDADLSLTWARTDEGDLLTGFSLVHASHRLRSHDIVDLAPSLLEAAHRLVDGAVGDDVPADLSGAPALSPHAEAIAASLRRVVTAIEVPDPDLRRRRSIDPPPIDAAAAHELADNLVQCAQTIGDLPVSSNHLAVHRSSHLVTALYDLADALRHGDGRLSPGSSAAARAALRGGVPLSRGEQTRLRHALILIDDHAAWPRASASLDELRRSIQRSAS